MLPDGDLVTYNMYHLRLTDGHHQVSTLFTSPVSPALTSVPALAERVTTRAQFSVEATPSRYVTSRLSNPLFPEGEKLQFSVDAELRARSAIYMSSN